MKQQFWIALILFVILVGGVYAFLKFNPPLEIGTLGSSEDEKSVVVEIGNNGFRELKILEVTVNNNEKPLKAKVQVSDYLKGLVIIKDFEDQKYLKNKILEIKDVTIKVDTSPSSNLKKSTAGNATADDETYGISIIHNEPVKQLHIKYRYFGVTFIKTVDFNNM